MQGLRIAARNLAVRMGGGHEAETEGEYVALLMELSDELHHAVNVSEGTTEPGEKKDYAWLNDENLSRIQELLGSARAKAVAWLVEKQKSCAHDWDEETTTCVRCGYQPPLDANGEPT